MIVARLFRNEEGVYRFRSPAGVSLAAIWRGGRSCSKTRFRAVDSVLGVGRRATGRDGAVSHSRPAAGSGPGRVRPLARRRLGRRSHTRPFGKILFFIPNEWG